MELDAAIVRMAEGSEAMHVLVIDDHLMVSQGLCILLRTIDPAIQADKANSLPLALDAAVQQRYDLVLLDWHLDGCSGAASIAGLRDAGCAAQIVVISAESSPSLTHTAIELGAAGFVPKRYDGETLVAALRFVTQGGVFLPPEARDSGWPPLDTRRTPLVEVEQCFAGLTPRQADVYRAATRGLPNKLIARELGITESTVKTHLQAVYAALGVRNRTEAAYQASREHIRVA